MLMSDYRVIEKFTDLQDDGHVYEPGDAFPRNGAKVTPERLEELASNSNRRGFPLIEKSSDVSSFIATPTQPEKAERGDSLEDKPEKVARQVAPVKEVQKPKRTPGRKKDNK
jgi:hypothetical protein